MEALPNIPIIDTPDKMYGIVYEQDEKTRHDKTLAYLNQAGLINYNIN